ncbi:glycosyltransferase [Methylobacterium sp. J-026]|uniref:glycosyltransferase n=1 Tax=Methylobacterium sp. J-026 TaxID=2836624 RepID=UPI001FB8D20E|nr:glycosyltransferase [Methylobacterium sp. J-026]
MILRIGWLTPFTNRSGVGTFSKAVTDAMPETYGDHRIELSIVTQISDGLYETKHRIIDIEKTASDSNFYSLFDFIIYNIGNNEEHHKHIFDVLRNYPGIVICHDYVYQHVLAKIVHDRGSMFADYVAIAARYGSLTDLRRVRQSNITQPYGLRYAVWDSEMSGDMPLGTPLFQLGSGLVVHSRYAERYNSQRFSGPVLCLGMPHDQRPHAISTDSEARTRRRRTIISFGHIQSTKCIHDVLAAIADSPKLRSKIVYVIAGFASDAHYLQKLWDFVAENNLGECVRFALNLSDAALEEQCIEADGFVNLRFPNTEGASVSLIEQLLTGKPVVVFDTGCYSEVPDDAVIKVAASRSVEAIASALYRLLEEPDTLARIGARGRDYARLIDCRSYACQVLGFIKQHEALLRRRALVHAESFLEGTRLYVEGVAEDASWERDLALARESLDLLEQGRLADDPVLIESLDTEALVEFVQAAILRSSTSRRLTVALHRYLAGKLDVVRRTRTIKAVKTAIETFDPSLIALFPDIVPYDDITFWEVVDAVTDQALITVAHAATYGSLPNCTPVPRSPDAFGPLSRVYLADALERRPSGERKVSSKLFEALTKWLRAAAGPECDIYLDPCPVGQLIRIGSDEQVRYLKMVGFYEIHGDHVWTMPPSACLFVFPAPRAKSIMLYGNTMDNVEDIKIAITAQTRAGPIEARQVPSNAGRVFEIALPDGSEYSQGNLLQLFINSDGCRSPREMGQSEDFRALGFQLKQVQVL